jgi:hypothetical protein
VRTAGWGVQWYLRTADDRHEDRTNFCCAGPETDPCLQLGLALTGTEPSERLAS